MADPSTAGAVLRPSFKEFQNFSAFLEENSSLILNCGVVKVIPPQEWTPIVKHFEPTFILTPPRMLVYEKENRGQHFLFKFRKQNVRWTYSQFQAQLEKNYEPLKTKTTTDDKFWQEFFKTKPLYSVDNNVSLFCSGTKQWNLNSLEDEFSSFAKESNIKVPGVTSPYVYVGSRFSTFSCHKEDMDLWSISFLHSGSPKQWYGIPEKFSSRIEDLYSQISEADDCSAPERHKHIFFNIKELPKDIQFTTVLQEKGNFVITGGRCFHQGFNWGLNVAEAINIAPRAYAQQPEPRQHKCSEDFYFNRQDFKQYLLKSSKPDTPPVALESTSFRRKDLSISIAAEEIYTFDDEDTDDEIASPPKKARGRPRKEEKLGDPSVRPLKKCPFCGKFEGKNWRRHLLSHSKTKTEEEIEKAERDATKRTVQGLRVCKPNLLPQSIQDLLKDDVTNYAFTKFLDDVGVVLPEATVKKNSKMLKPLAADEDVDDPDCDAEVTNPSEPKGSTKAKLESLGYPKLDENAVIVKCLKDLASSNPAHAQRVAQMLTPIRRIFGYIGYVTDKRDWELLTEPEKVKEYIQIIMTSGGAEATTCKNYLEHVLRLMDYAQERFFQDTGMPTDPNEHSLLMNRIKSSKNVVNDYKSEINKLKDKELATKKWLFGKSLPNIMDWEKYLEDPSIVRSFNTSLETLETASQEVWNQLEASPADSCLRSHFNVVVEYFGTSLLFLAARPGELSNCTFVELKNAEMVQEDLHVLVAKHKTGRNKQAVIEVPSERKEIFHRYVAILERFSVAPRLAFPFLSPSKGFCEHNNIYRRLNRWLSKEGLPLFTCTKLRKTMETNAALHGSTTDKTLVGSGLNHSAKTVERHYDVQTTEKNKKEKDAIKRIKDDAKFRSVLSLKPPKFPVNLKDGPFSAEELLQWGKTNHSLKNLEVSDEVYALYVKNWRECVLPILFAKFKEQLRIHKDKSTFKNTYEKMLQLLELPHFCPLKHSILQNLKKEKIID